MNKYKVDGIILEMNDPYQDQVSANNSFSNSMVDSGVTHIREPSELKDMLRELNDDSLDPKTNLSSIDMKSRLHFAEIPSILAVDCLVSYNFLSIEALAITRIKKRLAVSIAGEGRKESVDAIGRKNETDMKKGGFMQQMRGFFSGGE